ncbi:uncharacterized protein LOC123676092 [Harmonia axyridis]|uniref:uncharacterized protein LOC123676092 n=1 Tax=Harmonia axyridis TaxID=115357 RepID=UPI001E2767A6|nr:uncharacterized protein LOC123676092 [Harmonia axyridis]
MLDQDIMNDLEVFTKTIMKNEGIAEYDINIEGQTEKGTNYSSEIVFFSVTPKTVEKKYSFVMKTTKRSKKMRELSQDAVGDKREMHLYSKVAPAIRQMLIESASDFHLENMTQPYLVNEDPGHETMIMDNLKAKGFRLWDTNKPMNMEHIRTVLSNYGKYHASTMALRFKNPKVFANLTKEMNNIFAAFIDDEGVRKLFGDYMRDAIQILNKAGLKNIAEKLEEVPENVINILANCPNEEDKVLITHGDCWINNMMFKYKNAESLEPLGVCFLDFQLSSFGSPATDLSYFLYTSCDENTITNEFENLLQFYYDSFSSTLKKLALDPEEIFSILKLKDHWRKYAISGLIMAAFVIKVQLAKKDEAAPDISESGDLSLMKLGQIENNDHFESRIIAVFKNFAKTCM